MPGLHAGPLEVLAPALRSGIPGESAIALGLLERTRAGEERRGRRASPLGFRGPGPDCGSGRRRTERARRARARDRAADVGRGSARESRGAEVPRPARRPQEPSRRTRPVSRSSRVPRARRIASWRRWPSAAGTERTRTASRSSSGTARRPSGRPLSTRRDASGTSSSGRILVSQLAVPDFAPVAVSALVRIGPPVLGEIARAFGRDDLDPTVRYRSLVDLRGHRRAPRRAPCSSRSSVSPTGA